MKKKLVKIVVSFLLFIVALVIKSDNEWINNSLFIISYVIVGFDILKKAVTASET